MSHRPAYRKGIGFRGCSTNFFTTNRQLLIGRCREKVAKRFEHHEVKVTLDHGVPLFLQQLVETLREEQNTDVRNADSEPAPAPTEIGRTAAYMARNCCVKASASIRWCTTMEMCANASRRWRSNRTYPSPQTSFAH